MVDELVADGLPEVGGPRTELRHPGDDVLHQVEAVEVQGLNLHIRPGERVGLVGRSGAGSDLQCKVMDECVQLFGGYGYMWEYPITRAYADARVQRIYGGTNEIMKEVITRAMGLGPNSELRVPNSAFPTGSLALFGSMIQPLR